MQADGDENSVINLKQGMATYGDEQLFKNQVASVDSMTLEPGLVEMHEGWRKKDWRIVEKEAKKAKNSAR